MIPIEKSPNSIRIGGIGGQGNIKMGLILAKALTYDKKWVIQTQHYGAQVRGGIAHSDVLFCSDPIDYPVAYNFDILYMMHQKALDQYYKLVKPNGILFCDSTFVNKIPVTVRRLTRKIISFPVAEISKDKFGMPVLANVIGLGLLQKTTELVSMESLKKTVLEEVPERFKDLNLQALEYGYSLCEKSYAVKEKKSYIPVSFE